METIIKKAIEGGYKPENIHTKNKGTINFWHHNGKYYTLETYSGLMDHEFWQALGKACGWKKSVHEDISYYGYWYKYAMKFHEINLTEGWDKAVEYLNNLIKK